MKIGEHHQMPDGHGSVFVHVVAAKPTPERPVWRMRCGVEEQPQFDQSTWAPVTCLGCLDTTKKH